MKKDYDCFYPQLPPGISSKWKIVKALTSTASSQIYIIKSSSTSGSQKDIKILKIASKASVNKNIYKKIISIKSKYILKPLDIIPFKQNYYIITPYYDNLQKVICNNGISGSDILNMAHDICTSLKQLHAHKILHLDCTPANIYINEDGSYCLGDFSSAVLSGSKNTALTATTSGYMPPETIETARPGFLSDIYIFSCLLYALFNNGYTITSNSPDGNIKNNIPQELYSIIIKGCSKNPSERYSSIDEMEQELNSQIISEKLLNYNYYLHITDVSHPLYYLKTPLYGNAAIDDKKISRTHMLYSFLILTTGTIFLFSLYSYYTKNNLQKEKQMAHINIASGNTADIARCTPAPEPMPVLSDTANTTDDITELDISNKNLTSVPNPQSAGFSCNKLTCLYADNNKIADIDNIEYYQSLNELYLSDNLLTGLLPLEKTRHLEILVLSYNKITDLLPVCSLTSLIHLDISGNNKMYNFSELISLYNLKTLNVTNTNITKEEIDFLLYHLPDCEILY